MYVLEHPHTTYLCVPLVSEEDVAAVQVAVNNALGVDVAHAPCCLQRVPVEEPPNFTHTECFRQNRFLPG